VAVLLGVRVVRGAGKWVVGVDGKEGGTKEGGSVIKGDGGWWWSEED